MSDKTSDLKSFAEQLKSKKKDIIQPVIKDKKQDPQKIEVQKNLVLGFSSDFSGCGHIRSIIPLTYVNSILGKTQKLMTLVTPMLITQQDLMTRCRTMILQRWSTDQHLMFAKEYKRLQNLYKYLISYDHDDNVFGKNETQGGTKEEGIPSYNFGGRNITDKMRENQIEIMNMSDIITVSTDYMKQMYMEWFGFPDWKIRVIPNTVPQFLFRTKRKSPIKEKIKVPHIVYTGSPTHYLNPNEKMGIKPMLGDWENAWKDYIIKNVKDGKIRFTCFGGLPWFFQEIKDKINIVPWKGSFQYPLELVNMAGDIGISPLVPNMFNYQKSDIKHIEYCATGHLSIGTVFSNGKPSPYDGNIVTIKDTCEEKDINELIDKVTEPEMYNAVIQRQYDYLMEEHRYLEDPVFFKFYLEALLTPPSKDVKISLNSISEKLKKDRGD